MNDTANGEARVPDFIDKVDSLDEFQDACVSEAEMAAFAIAHPRPKPQPREPASDGRIPDFVEIVDSVDVFLDAPLPGNIKVQPGNSAGPPAPTTSTDPSKVTTPTT